MKRNVRPMVFGRVSLALVLFGSLACSRTEFGSSTNTPRTGNKSQQNRGEGEGYPDTATIPDPGKRSAANDEEDSGKTSSTPTDGTNGSQSDGGTASDGGGTSSSDGAQQSSGSEGSAANQSSAEVSSSSEGGQGAQTPTPKPQFTGIPEPGGEGETTAGGKVTRFSLDDGNLTTEATRKVAWTVTNSEVRRIEIDPAKNYPQKKWSRIEDNWGNRTYVTEIGLIIGETNRGGKTGGVTLASDRDPNKTQRILTAAQLGQRDESRVCVTSYKLQNQAYIGGAYRHTDGNQKFFRVPLDSSKPLGVDTAKLEIFQAGAESLGSHGGYSCYIDQSRHLFWFASYNRAPTGFDLNKNVPIPITSAPNGNQKIALSDFSVDLTKAGSYALSGDGSGNVLTANWTYTFAYEPISGFVFGSNLSGKFFWTQSSCFARDVACALNEKHFKTSDNFLKSMSAMSSLNDGTVIGIIRGDPSQIFQIWIKDMNDPGAGVGVKKIAEVPGDTYMYTDFTGATLYAADRALSWDFKKYMSFKASIPIKKMTVKWEADGGAGREWRGLSLKMRCLAGTETPQEFTIVSPVPTSSEPFDVSIPSCKRAVDKLEVKVTADGVSNDYSKVTALKVSVEQQ